MEFTSALNNLMDAACNYAANVYSIPTEDILTRERMQEHAKDTLKYRIKFILKEFEKYVLLGKREIRQPG